MIKISGITNSSVFQIGTSGIITPVSNLYNTGDFEEPAPEAVHLTELEQSPLQSIVPL